MSRYLAPGLVLTSDGVVINKPRPHVFRPWPKTKKHKERLCSGVALEGHMNDAHEGEFDETCPACNDICRRMEKLKQNENT